MPGLSYQIVETILQLLNLLMRVYEDRNNRPAFDAAMTL